MPIKYKAKVKSRSKSSQTTGYKRIEEWQFIISVSGEFKGENYSCVIITGRWFPTAKIAKAMAKLTAKHLNIELDWDREVNVKSALRINGGIAIKKFIDRFGDK